MQLPDIIIDINPLFPKKNTSQVAQTLKNKMAPAPPSNIGLSMTLGTYIWIIVAFIAIGILAVSTALYLYVRKRRRGEFGRKLTKPPPQVDDPAGDPHKLDDVWDEYDVSVKVMFSPRDRDKETTESATSTGPSILSHSHPSATRSVNPPIISASRQHIH
ncbi:hypothetical protein DXG01_011333 [Tephrocybe rancida]|nr:hypothetical protein DXG01_011333 [Tephrocybe rancida]